LLNRQNDLHIFGPKGIKEIINLQLKLSNSWLKYGLHFHELESVESELIFEDENVEVHTIPLEHRIYTNGFLFKEKIGERKLNIIAIKQNSEIETCDYQNLKNGKDFTKENGEVIDNEKLTFNPPKQLSYAYCSDTVYKPAIVSLIKNSDLLYHESTFLDDKIDLTVHTKHSTAKQAAEIAKLANVGKLILGHYSSRYNDISLFKEEAKTTFENVTLGEAGKIITVETVVNKELVIAHQN
jgi:ribonuclease Z